MKFKNMDSEGSRPVFAPPRDAVTGNQISILLNAASAMTHCMNVSEGSEDGGPNDGGARTAAEVSFIKICTRLDSILDDKARWSMEGQDTLEKDMSEMLKGQAAESRSNIRSKAVSLLPHVRYNPAIVKITSEAWVCFVGDITNKDESMIAMGLSPQESINNFDLVFMGRALERTHQDMLDEVLKQLNRKRESLTHEIKMDARGRSTVTEIEIREEGAQGDSPSTGPDESSS